MRRASTPRDSTDAPKQEPAPPPAASQDPEEDAEDLDAEDLDDADLPEAFRRSK